MSPIQSLILGLIQGLTEFVPVSSSGHLVLVPWLLGWPQPDEAFVLAFDTVLHLGTLAAILAVFWHDWIGLAAAWLQSIRQRSLANPKSRLAWALVLGTIPAAVLGVAFEDAFERLFATPVWAALFLVGTGVLLVAGERWGQSTQALTGIGARHALLTGVAQGLAIAPGLSRSGATISAGRLLGLRRDEAARFSFLLATPAIAGAGALQLVKLARADMLLPSAGILLIGFVTALVSGYVVIRWLLRYLQQHSLLPFAIYCWSLGLICLAVWLLR